MTCKWVLVAESSRAKFYRTEKKNDPFEEIEALVHPSGRMHEGDLKSDRSGSDGGSVGQGRHVMAEKVTARQHEHMEFARMLAERLENARNSGAYDELILVAPPAFLGLLRNNLSKGVMAMVSREVDKNLVQQPPEALRSYV